jgi:hypothetical protein
MTRGGLIGWVGGDRGWRQVTYTIGKAFMPTGATTLPDGKVLVLESRQPLVATRLRHFNAEEVRTGEIPEPKELALLEGSLAFHNIQGISARQGSSGETLIYLVSDDNYIGPQPTAILMFELVPGEYRGTNEEFSIPLQSTAFKSVKD